MSNKKIFAIIFLLAFLMRMAALFSFAEEKSLLYVSDSLTYIQVAKNIINHGVYSMEISDTPHPDNFRTPLYPIFLIPFVWLKTSLYVPAIVQCIIMSLGVALIFLLGQKIFNRKVAIIATILFAIEPVSALISAQILTEAIFVSLFVPAILLMTLYIKKNNTLLLYLASILLAFSALTRPIAFPFIALIPIATWLNRHAAQQGYPWKKTFIALVVFFGILSPWLWFNWSQLHTLKFSSVNDMQIYAYHGKIFDSWRQQHGAPASDRLPDMDLSPINNTFNASAIPQFKMVGLNYIKNHLPQYFIFHLLRIPKLFTNSGHGNILNGLSFLHSYHDTSSVILWLADFLFILLTILAITNPLWHNKLKKEWPFDKLFLIMVIIIYALLSSPIGGARLRIPINPLIFILSVDALYLIKKLSHSNKQSAKKLTSF